MSEYKEGLNNPEQNYNPKIGDINPIDERYGMDVLSREDLKKLVEAPLLSACEELYDKNIITIGSSANKKDLSQGYTVIVIDFDSLSELNKQIGQQIGQVDKIFRKNVLNINIPVGPESTSNDIALIAREIVSKFQKQRFKPETYTIQKMRKMHGINPDDESYPPESFDQFYWNPKDKIFFKSKEHSDKASEDIQE